MHILLARESDPPNATRPPSSNHRDRGPGEYCLDLTGGSRLTCWVSENFRILRCPSRALALPHNRVFISSTHLTSLRSLLLKCAVITAPGPTQLGCGHLRRHLARRAHACEKFCTYSRLVRVFTVLKNEHTHSQCHVVALRPRRPTKSSATLRRTTNLTQTRRQGVEALRSVATW